MNTHRVFAYSFSSVYPLYITKALNKGYSKSEVDEIIYWLTGYDSKSLQETIDNDINLESFFRNAPKLNPNRSLIKGVICGVRLEEIEEEMMREIRYLDKLVDELARGKSMDKILRK